MAIDFSQYKTAEAPIQPSSSQTNFNGLSNNSSLSASTLAPTQSISIPPAPPENATSSFGNELELLTKNTGTAKKEESQSFNDLLASLNAPGSADLTNQAYGANNGVDQLQLELNDINSQILSEQEGLRRQIEEIQDRGGMTVSGAASTIDAARRKSLRTQADLAVIQLSKQGRYDSAKAIADRAVTAILERQKNQQQLRMMAYERSKEAFTKAEQREFETRQKERDRQLAREEQNLRTISDISLDALQNGAPTSIAAQMRSAKTVEEAISIGGQYIGKYDRVYKQMQIANLQSQMSERNAHGAKPLTSAQYTALGYGQRMLSSSLTIDEVGEQFAKLGSQFAYTPNFLKSQDRQRFEQASRNFINAALRRESGAAIAPEEFESAKLQYFPQPGDSKEVLIQKKQNRDLVTRNILREGGQDTTPQDASLADPLQLGIGGITSNPLNL